VHSLLLQEDLPVRGGHKELRQGWMRLLVLPNQGAMLQMLRRM